MEPASVEEVYEFACRIRADSALWQLFIDNVGLWFPAEADVALLQFARTYEQEAGIYISPESCSSAIVTLRIVASGKIAEDDAEAMKKRIHSSLRLGAK
jgi:hypothetical protein